MIELQALERAMVLIEIRRVGMHPEMVSELEHYMYGVDRDPEDWPTGYTEADALQDMEMRLDDAIRAGSKEAWALAIRTQLRDAEVALGLVVPASYLDTTCLQWFATPAYRHKKVVYYWEGSRS